VKIIDEALLDEVRHRDCCEWCGKPRRPLERLEPHHILGRGHGGGLRMDARLNLMGVHWECHDKAQANRRKCLEIVAARDGYPSGEAVLDKLRELQRATKEQQI